MRVLIADDDRVSLSILTAALLRAGYEVEVAHNGQEALEKLRTGPCRLLISDWEMPEINGLELCQMIRAGDFPAYIYIIMLTSHSDSRYTVLGLSAGADDFITKPFNPAELTMRVRTGERILSLETRDVAIFALAKLAESRDPETGAHLERVQSYARVLAVHLSGIARYRGQIDSDYVRMIYSTAPLHDVGKVGIPDAVLLKPGKLTPDEFQVMKTHALIGARTLSEALERFPGTRFLEMARDIAASHHEKFDGSGYPNRLAGDAIPLCGRIVALADVYDALSSKRVYKDAFSHEMAKSLIVKDAGKHFDPGVVEAFLANEAAFISIRERFSTHEAAAA